MNTILIRNAEIINEGIRKNGDIFIRNGRIEKIARTIDRKAEREIDASGKIVIPGVIDDQVHFREPGMDYKATVFTESRAALAGGVTSFMDMPNTKPASLTQELLEKRYEYAAKYAAINYSFYMGSSNDNLEEVLQTKPGNVCGIKIFMGSSTGNMLVDDAEVLETIFSKSPMLIATHCEDEKTILQNQQDFNDRYGESLDAGFHPKIRTDEACYLSSSFAVRLAKKLGTRLHVLHLTSAREMPLFDADTPLEDKLITAEVCVHHLYFNQKQYRELGNKLKCNPAVKTEKDQLALWKALEEDRLDVIATDHAPHTLEEKQLHYTKAPSGLPLVQHSLYAMLEMNKQGRISLERIVDKMCHAPAIVFRIKERGFIREGYYADLTILDLEADWKVSKENILYKCAWSPFEGKHFHSKVCYTIVNGVIAFENNGFSEMQQAMRLVFDR